MTTSVTPRYLFEKYCDQLRLEWVAGIGGGDKPIPSTGAAYTGMALVGHLNFIRRPRVPVLGVQELEYLANLEPGERAETVASIFSTTSPFVVVSNDQPVPDDLIAEADRCDIPLFTSILSSHELISHLHYYLANLLAERLTIHGVFLEVMGSGVLLTGEAGLGKSELALELISRGHRLIADDAPEFSRIAPDIVNGTCPEPLRDFLEVRGLGVLNIKAMFGSNAVKSSRYLRLIIDLKPASKENTQGLDRIYGTSRPRNVLGLDIPEITLFVAPGRNLAVLVETAVRHHLLVLKGYDAAKDFVARQNQLIQDQGHS
ncbi:MAG: HPr(Ser) kinase/phosphatase [Gammaproteobacteria bacterium]